MAATLATAPAARAYSKDPIWIGIETDLITGVAGYFEITIADGGPADTETLTLTWPGGSVTYTAAASPDDSGLQWPLQGLSTLENYTRDIAEVLRHREDVAEVFVVTLEDAPGGVIRLTARNVEAFALSITDGMANVAVTKTDGTAASAEDNLRAYVEVWADSSDFNGQSRLAAFHSPYDVATSATDLDISAAFAHLKPHLPDAATINPVAAPSALPFDEASDCFQKYFLRLADKYGAPAVAEALVKTDSYVAIHGSRSIEAFSTTLYRLLHKYFRRDEADFRKPVGTLQPDWVYYMPASGDTVYVTLTVYWSDGTESTYNPWDTDTETLASDTAYWFVSGYTQLLLDDLAPSGGTDPDAYITGYDWKLKGSPVTPLATVRYDVLRDSDWGKYLLFDNGQGGMETVWLRGKSSEAYATVAEEYQRPRRQGDTVTDGDFGIYAASGRPQWELNTGWYDDPFYLEHLRQLPLAQAWLIDVFERRFLKVIVQPGTLEEIQRDDETLYNLKFSIKAAWLDQAANI